MASPGFSQFFFVFLRNSWFVSWTFLVFPGFAQFYIIFLKRSWLLGGCSWISSDFLGFPLFLFDFHICFIGFWSPGDARELREESGGSGAEKSGFLAKSGI